MRSNSKILIFVLYLNLIGLSPKAQDYNIYFDYNSDVMRIDDVEKLHDLIKDFNPNTNTIKMIGYADTTGNSKYNLELSKRRVTSIRDYLVRKGVAISNVKTDYKGEYNAVSADNFYNRRVEIYLQTKEKEIKTFEEFTNSLKPSRQQYKFPSNSDLRIEGKKGTVVKIPANSFSYLDGKPANGELQLILTEYYSIKDFFSEKLTTISDGNLLLSGGMVNINAYKDGKELQLYKDAEIELAFPKSSENNFFTFYGERKNDGTMNWVLDKKSYEKAREKVENVYGATFSLSGDSIIVTDNYTAYERNKNLNVDMVTKKIVVNAENEKSDIEKYKKEQGKINMARYKYYNILRSSKLKFINCDTYIRDATIVNYKVGVENNDVKIISASLILRNTKSIISFGSITNKELLLMARLPSNESFELLVIGEKDGELYAYFDFVKLSDNKEDKVTLRKSVYSALRSRL